MLQLISLFVRAFPLPIVSRALSFFPSPQPVYDTKRPLRRRETQVESGLKVIRGQFAPTNFCATIGNLTSTCFKYSKWFAHCRRTSYCIYSIWSFALTVPGVISKVLSNGQSSYLTIIPRVRMGSE